MNGIIIFLILAIVSFAFGFLFSKKNPNVSGWSVNKKQAISIAWACGAGALWFMWYTLLNAIDIAEYFGTLLTVSVFAGVAFNLGLKKSIKSTP